MQDGYYAPGGGNVGGQVANGGGIAPGEDTEAGQDAAEGGNSPGEDTMAGQDATEGGNPPGEDTVAGQNANDGGNAPGEGGLSDGGTDDGSDAGIDTDESDSDYVLIDNLMLAAAAKRSNPDKIHFVSASDLLGCPAHEFPEKIRKLLADAKGREWVIVPIKFQGHWLQILIEPKLRDVTIFDSHLKNLADREVEVYLMVQQNFTEPLEYHEPFMAEECSQQRASSGCQCHVYFDTNLSDMLDEIMKTQGRSTFCPFLLLHLSPSAFTVPCVARACFPPLELLSCRFDVFACPRLTSSACRA